MKTKKDLDIMEELGFRLHVIIHYVMLHPYFQNKVVDFEFQKYCQFPDGIHEVAWLEIGRPNNDGREEIWSEWNLIG